jgi:hypothetical protein
MFDPPTPEAAPKIGLKWFGSARQSKRKARRREPTFEAYYLQQLRTRYNELADEFWAIEVNSKLDDKPNAQSEPLNKGKAHVIREALDTAQKSLEEANPDLLAIASNLNSVDRSMVWILSAEALSLRARVVMTRVTAQRLNIGNPLATILTELLGPKSKVPIPLDTMRSLLDQLIGQINERALEDLISNGLQIQRLRALRPWSIGVVLLSILAAPFVINPNMQPAILWPIEANLAWNWGVADRVIDGWISALTIAVLGATGGFLSGLLQARSSHITLLKYQENLLKLQLKPIVGAIVAVILFMFLSWKLLIGVSLESAGSFFVLAFIAGFSERYFLRLLEINREEREEQASSTTTVAQVQQPDQTTTVIQSEESKKSDDK